MTDELDDLKRDHADALHAIDDLRAQRNEYALPAARGADAAQVVLDDLTAREQMAIEAARDLELAIARLESEIAEAKRETAERNADADFAEARRVADEMRADAGAADKFLSELAGIFARRGHNIDRLRKLRALDSGLANRMDAPLTVQRVLAHWLAEAMGRNGLGISNVHKTSMAEVDGGILKMIKRPATRAAA